MKKIAPITKDGLKRKESVKDSKYQINKVYATKPIIVKKIAPIAKGGLTRKEYQSVK